MSLYQVHTYVRICNLKYSTYSMYIFTMCTCGYCNMCRVYWWSSTAHTMIIKCTVTYCTSFLPPHVPTYVGVERCLGILSYMVRRGFTVHVFQEDSVRRASIQVCIYPTHVCLSISPPMCVRVSLPYPYVFKHLPHPCVFR